MQDNTFLLDFLILLSDLIHRIFFSEVPVLHPKNNKELSTNVIKAVFLILFDFIYFNNPLD
jgi:hypothetical protein